MDLNQQRIVALATELKGLRSAGAIRRFRSRLDKATAQQVIRSPVLSDVERAAISLCLQFSSDHPRDERWNATIFDADSDGIKE